MAQEWFAYSFVARKSVILAEYITPSSNLLPSIAAQWLQSVLSDPEPHHKFSSNFDQFTFFFLVEGIYVYAVAAKNSIQSQISFELLERIKKDFKARYDHGERDAAVAKSLTMAFGPIMKQHMDNVACHADEVDNLDKVKTQVSEVQVIISNNINKVIEKGEHINTVADNAERLPQESIIYQQRATEVKRKTWIENTRKKFIIAGFALILTLIIWVSICDGFYCKNSSNEE